MAEEARIREAPEGQRKHLWWDTEKHFPFMTMDRGWQFCPYCGGFKFKGGEKFIFPNLEKNEKGEEVQVEKDIGCQNVKLRLVKQVKPEVKQEAAPAKTEDKDPPKEEKAPEEKPKKRGILKGFRK